MNEEFKVRLEEDFWRCYWMLFQYFFVSLGEVFALFF